jgi:L-ascorbate metabolism protein UlaG (beta-lactamase superfamily)
VARISTKEAVKQLATHLRKKTAGLRNGGRHEDHDEHQIGLTPGRGWARRNLEFVQRVLIPATFTKRSGEHLNHDFDPPPADRARVFWIGHASFLIQMGGKNILVDPNWALWLKVVKRMRQPGLKLADLPRIDLICVSHAHHDHLDVPTLRKIADGQPILVPKGVGSLVKRLGFGPVIEMTKWDAADLEGLRVTFTPAKHWGARYVHDIHRGFGGFLFQAPDCPSVYHAGDSAYFPGFHEIGERFPIDVALLPIGAYRPVSGRSVHMNPEEALAAFVDLKAQKMVPMHYGTFPLTREPLDEPLQRLVLRSSADGLRNRIVVLSEGEAGEF